MSTTISNAREIFYQISNEANIFEQKLDVWIKSEVEKSEKLYSDHNLVISNEEGKFNLNIHNKNFNRTYSKFTQKIS